MNRLLIVLILVGVAEAHSGNRLYPFYELTDEMLEKIDLHDGLIDEWYEIGEPSMTLLDFKAISGFFKGHFIAFTERDIEGFTLYGIGPESAQGYRGLRRTGR